VEVFRIEKSHLPMSTRRRLIRSEGCILEEDLPMERHYGWVIVAAGAVITCVAMGAMFALPVYLQPMADQTGWTRAGISGAMTVGFLVMGVAGFFWGTLTDRIGARPVVLIAAVMLGLGLFIASRATDLLVFQFAYGGLVGASGGAFFAPLMATTIGWFDKNRSLAVSLVSLGGGVAPMVITPLATVLIQIYGWRDAMMMTAITATVLILPLSLLIRRAPEMLAASPTPSSDVEPAEHQPTRMGAVFRTPQFFVLAGVFFFCFAVRRPSRRRASTASKVLRAFLAGSFSASSATGLASSGSSSAASCSRLRASTPTFMSVNSATSMRWQQCLA
jgi:MFS family permease